MTGALLYQFQAMSAAATPQQTVSLNDLPSELTSRFVSKDGKWLVQVYPKDELWDIGPLQRFVDDVRTVDPDVTGVPLQNFEASQQIRTSYEKAALYAFGVVWVVLLIDFLKSDTKWLVLAPPAVIVAFLAMTLVARRVTLNPVLLVTTYIAMSAAMAAILDARNLRDGILAMMPPVLGGVTMFGVLGLLGVNLNAANLICLPLILGIGVENGVHVVHDFRRQSGSYIPTPSMINANVMTSLTTMIGFGSMMVAAHRGLYSLGLVLTVGVACSLFVSLVLLPSILTLLARRAEAGAGADTHRLDERRSTSSGRSDILRHPMRRAA
jgi:predicted RND superfamily exporter protein